jgi:hypothetical protein
MTDEEDSMATYSPETGKHSARGYRWADSWEYGVGDRVLIVENNRISAEGEIIRQTNGGPAPRWGGEEYRTFRLRVRCDNGDERIFNSRTREEWGSGSSRYKVPMIEPPYRREYWQERERREQESYERARLYNEVYVLVNSPEARRASLTFQRELSKTLVRLLEEEKAREEAERNVSDG